MFRQATLSALLISSLVLAGCGTSATLSTVSVPSAAMASGPSIVTTVTRGAAPERQHTQLPAAPAAPAAPQLPAAPVPAVGSYLQLNGHIELTDEILAEDAESQGYSVASVNAASKLEKKFSKTGVIRRTAEGYSLQPSNSLFKFFKKKDKNHYTLTGAPEVMTQLADRENKKTLIKGTVDKDNVVTVLSVKGLADLGFLTNWFTKGKIVGKAVDRETGLPLVGAEVAAQSAEGFVFSTVSEDDGTFQIKSLTPGDYTVTVKLDGYDKLDGAAVEVRKHKASDVTVKLAPEPAADPVASN